jgi:signal transduction histidine kinase
VIEDNSLQTFLAILTGVIVMVIMAGFIIAIVIVHRQRQIRNRHKIQIIKADFKNTILNAEKEIREQTLLYVSQELHDNIGQLLSLTKLVLNNPDPAAVFEGKKLINQIIKEVRSLSRSINKDYIIEVKFEVFLEEELAKIQKSGFCEVSFEKEGLPVDFVEGDKKLVLIRMVQECLNNAIKHASPSLITIKLRNPGDKLILCIEDNGEGYDVANVTQGLGLRNMHSRVQAIGGNLEIASNVGQGTQIKIELEHDE